MRIVFADDAVADLEEIGDYIANDNPGRALIFVRKLREVALQLADMPRAFPFVPRYEHVGIRRRPVGDYLIFYRIEDDRITIIHILHGARDYDGLLFPSQ